MTNADFCTYLQENLGCLASGSKIGALAIEPNDIKAIPNELLETRGLKNHHFSFNVPYAGTTLKWEMVFDPDDFSELPDFYFNDDSFLKDADVHYILEHVPLWSKWDLRNPQAVCTLMKEFLILFKKCQIEKLNVNNRLADLKTQFDNLLNACDMDNIEVLIGTTTKDEFQSAKFLISIPLDFSKILYYYADEPADKKDNDYLHLIIELKNLGNVQSKVILSSSSKGRCLIEKIKLPKYTRESTLLNYTQTVKTLIENQIALFEELHEHRRKFILSLVEHYATSVVEYDTVKYKKMSFLYEVSEDYTCLVTVSLYEKFPQTTPKVELHSLFCQVGKNCNSNPKWISYNGDETVEDNMKTLEALLKCHVSTFRDHRH